MSFTKEVALDRLHKARTAGRLAHAYLLTGPVGCGKMWLARELSALCLGTDPARLLKHPDAHMVQPESKSRRITVDQIRELEQAIQRKPLEGEMKVAIIREADRLQPQAANAFLKTLEEPPPGSLILLLSALPEAMLETVLSRCVETPLHGIAPRQRGPEEAALLKALEESLLRSPSPGVAEAFRFTRTVRDILASLRESIASEYDDALKADVARYKQTSDGGSWLSDRAEQVKSLTEAGAQRERERVLQIISDTLCGALRARHGQAADSPTAEALAEKYSEENLLRRIDALETMRRRLALGTQEALALESGFLEMISLP